MANTVNLTIRIDRRTKQEAEILARKLGTNLSNVVNMLTTGFVRTRKIPESYVNAGEEPNAETRAALAEGDEIIKQVKAGTYAGKIYDNLDEMWADLEEGDGDGGDD